MTSNCYELLDVDVTASEEEIRQAYYKKAKLLHPDRNGLPAEKFHTIQRAYETLMNPRTRAQHDRDLGVQQRFGFSRGHDHRASRASIFSKLGDLLFKAVHGICSAVLSIFKSIFGIFAIRKKRNPDMSDPLSERGRIVPFPGTLRFVTDTEDTLPFDTREPIRLVAPEDDQQSGVIFEALCAAIPTDVASTRAALVQVIYPRRKRQQATWLLQLQPLMNEPPYPERLELLSVPDLPSDLIVLWAGDGGFSEAVWSIGKLIPLAPEAQQTA